jgi:hypothetical protein
VQRSRYASAPTEDELADLAVRRGRNAGGSWLLGSFVAFGFGLVARSPQELVVAWLIGVALFVVGLLIRSRYWRSARRRLGDATIQRAQWRSTKADRDGSDRVLAAIAIVLLLLAFELWRG